MNPEPQLSPGTILQGTYRIVRPLAEGGFGEVYIAAHTRLPGQFAVKVLQRGLAGKTEAISRFRQEAEITSALRHPHIVQVIDYNLTDDGHPYLVMELLEGQLLGNRILEAGALDPASALHIVQQIAHALHAAHIQGIVHRDLKPDNVILLSGEGIRDFVKVLDFGISQASWRPRLTGSAHVAGTPQYMAPEQAQGLRDEIDARSDQFSLAAIAYQLLTGCEAFSADDPVAVLYQVVHVDPVVPSSHAPGLSAAVDEVILRGMAKRSADRYPEILAFADALRAAIVPEAAAAARVPAVAVVPRPHRPDAFEPTLDRRVEVASTGAPAGPETVRLIRRMRWRLHRRPRRLAMMALAAAAAFAWFSPRTRDTTRDTVRRVQTQVVSGVRLGWGWVVGRASAATAPAQDSSRSAGVAIP